MALMTGTGGGDGERDMVTEIDCGMVDDGLLIRWRFSIRHLEILQAPQPPFSFSLLATSF